MPNKKTTGKGSADYYKDSPDSLAKKRAYQREYNKRPDQVKKRSELIKINREADKRGVKRGDRDFDHATNKYVDKSVNRGRTSKGNTPGTKGDARARGGKKK